MANSLNEPLSGEVVSRGKYHEGIPEQVKELCLLGLTNKQIAGHIDISLGQLAEWRHEHTEFAQALIDGREAADGKVAASLYNRALGVSVVEHKETITENGSIVTITNKQLPPDVAAASLILRNHQSGKFKDTKEITGKVSFEQMLDELESGGG